MDQLLHSIDARVFFVWDSFGQLIELDLRRLSRGSFWVFFGSLELWEPKERALLVSARLDSRSTRSRWVGFPPKSADVPLILLM